MIEESSSQLTPFSQHNEENKTTIPPTETAYQSLEKGGYNILLINTCMYMYAYVQVNYVLWKFIAKRDFFILETDRELSEVVSLGSPLETVLDFEFPTEALLAPVDVEIELCSDDVPGRPFDAPLLFCNHHLITTLENDTC